MIVSGFFRARLRDRRRHVDALCRMTIPARPVKRALKGQRLEASTSEDRAARGRANMAGPARGTFTLSLDLELFWGVHDKRSLAAYGGNILGARDAILRLLDLFESHRVRCTWATVGFLFFDDKDELYGTCPSSSLATPTPSGRRTACFPASVGTSARIPTTTACRWSGGSRLALDRRSGPTRSRTITVSRRGRPPTASAPTCSPPGARPSGSASGCAAWSFPGIR